MPNDAIELPVSRDQHRQFVDDQVFDALYLPGQDGVSIWIGTQD